MMIQKILSLFCNLAILGALPFVFVGVVNRVKSVWAGRQGPSLFQFWYDTLKLLRKGEVVSPTTSYVFRLAPTINLAAVLCAGLLAPLSDHASIINFPGNVVLFAYILAFGKFFSVISALDTGSSFEGMGASREVTFSSLAEPGFFVLIASAALLTGNLHFEELFTSLTIPGQPAISILITTLMALALFLLLLVEGCRVPVDDPNTHLELTMIHEVMILDNSGVDLAFLTYANAMKMVAISAILANMLIPQSLGWLLSTVLLVIIILLAAALVGCIESLTARVRMTHVPQVILLMSSIGLIVVCNLMLFYRN